jgi:hypothetical protein
MLGHASIKLSKRMCLPPGDVTSFLSWTLGCVIGLSFTPMTGGGASGSLT